MNYQSFLRCLTIILPSLAVAAMAEVAYGHVTAYQSVKLQEQIARADYVAHVVIEETQSLAHVDNGPVESCGVKYRVRVVERFKGAPKQEVSSFATNRLLLPQGRLRKGDHVLVLLRNAPKSLATVAAVEAANTFAIRETVGMSASTEACRRARGDYYLNDSAENIFAITFEPGGKAWFELSTTRTSLPSEIGSPLSPPCEPAGRGCIQQGPDRVEWARVREALIAANEREK